MVDRNDVSEVTSKAKEKGAHLADEGREKAEELAHKAGDMARSRAEEEMDRVASGIRTVADALRRGAEDLPEERQAYGKFVDAVADRAEGLSQYLEARDVNDMAREARRFAREHTGVVLSGAFALGLLGARFLKSSGDEVSPDRWVSRGYTSDGAYESGYRTSGGYPQTGDYEQAGGYGQPGGYSRGEVRSAGRSEGLGGAGLGTDREASTELGGPGVGRDPSGLNLDRPDDRGEAGDPLDRTGGA